MRKHLIKQIAELSVRSEREVRDMFGGHETFKIEKILKALQSQYSITREVNK